MGVWKALAARFRIDIFCGLFMEESNNEGLDLSPETLILLGERRFVLALDVYGKSE
jgi:hypothetical protein